MITDFYGTADKVTSEYVSVQYYWLCLFKGKKCQEF